MTADARTGTGRRALATIAEAEAVRDELTAALHGAGITLPSLRLDPVSGADENPRPLVDLGRCNMQTARKIAAALRTTRA
jgi:hypothetical protein